MYRSKIRFEEEEKASAANDGCEIAFTTRKEADAALADAKEECYRSKCDRLKVKYRGDFEPIEDMPSVDSELYAAMSVFRHLIAPAFQKIVTSATRKAHSRITANTDAHIISRLVRTISSGSMSRRRMLKSSLRSSSARMSNPSTAPLTAEPILSPMTRRSRLISSRLPALCRHSFRESYLSRRRAIR